MRFIPSGKLEEWLAEHGRIDMLGKEAELDDDELLRLMAECEKSHPDYDHDTQFAWAAYTILTKNVLSKSEREAIGEAGAGELAAFSRAAGAQAKAFWGMHGKLEDLLKQQTDQGDDLGKRLNGVEEDAREAWHELRVAGAKAEIEIKATIDNFNQQSHDDRASGRVQIAMIVEEHQAETARAVAAIQTGIAQLRADNENAKGVVLGSISGNFSKLAQSILDGFLETRRFVSAIADANEEVRSKERASECTVLAKERKLTWYWRIAVAALLGLLLLTSNLRAQSGPFVEFQDEGVRVRLFAAGIARHNLKGSGVTCVWNATSKTVDCTVTSGPGAGNAAFSWEDPETADSGKWAAHYAIPATISRVYCSTNTGTVNLNFEIRTEDAPNTTGDEVLSSAIVCDSDGAFTTTIQNASILPNRLVTPIVVSTSGTPTVIRAAAIVNPTGAGSAGNASFGWENPVTGDSGKWMAYYSQDATISKVYCFTNAGTVDLNFEIRTEDAPNSTGTTVLSVPLTCDSDGASTAIILNDSIPATRLLTPIVVSTSGSPGVIGTSVVTQ